jgi:hypothetical protein
MRVAPRRQLTNLLAALTMVATLAGLAYGLPAADRALPAERPVRSDRPYPVGAGVTVEPPDAAAVDLTRTRPGARRGTVVFIVGPVRYALTVRSFEGTLDDATGRLRLRITGNPGYQVTGAETDVTTETGLSGRQGGYTGPGRGGRYAVYLADGLSIEVMITGAGLDLGPVMAAIEASTRSIRYGAPG